jgi:hypothetical protein
MITSWILPTLFPKKDIACAARRRMICWRRLKNVIPAILRLMCHSVRKSCRLFGDIWTIIRRIVEYGKS